MTVRQPLRTDRRGFTLLELLIALLIGVIILASATSVATSMFRSVDGMRDRDDVVRQGRFTGMSLDRDLSETGVELASDIAFGSLAARGDTLSILSVQFDTAAAPVYRLVAKPDPDPLLPPGGSCGALCINLKAPVTGASVELEPGDLMLLNAGGSRRLAIVGAVTPIVDSTAVTMLNMNTILFRPGTLSGGLRLPRGSTSAQRLRAVTYWAENGSLMRSERFDANGNLMGTPIAEGVDSFVVRLVFGDGTEAAFADPTDGSAANDYDDIVSVRLRLVLRADSTSLAGRRAGAAETRGFDWRFSPRNLIYERNRRR